MSTVYNSLMPLWTLVKSIALWCFGRPKALSPEATRLENKMSTSEVMIRKIWSLPHKQRYLMQPHSTKNQNDEPLKNTDRLTGQCCRILTFAWRQTSQQNRVQQIGHVILYNYNHFRSGYALLLYLQNTFWTTCSLGDYASPFNCKLHTHSPTHSRNKGK